MPLSPYIAFSGNCAAAIAFYQHALGTELPPNNTSCRLPQDSQHVEDGCPSGQHLAADGIAHASLRIADGILMLSDSPSSKMERYAGFTIVLDPKDDIEGKRWFDGLADGGQIEMAWQETFWAHGFGKVIDRFGVPWMVNVVKEP